MYPIVPIEEKGDLVSFTVKKHVFYNGRGGIENCSRAGLSFSFAYQFNLESLQRVIREADGSSFVVVEEGDNKKLVKPRYIVRSEDIYLLLEDKSKIMPVISYGNKLAFGISSEIINDYQKKRGQWYYATFLPVRMPCNTALKTLEKSKLVISKIYKDNKVVMRDVEFGFKLARKKLFEPYFQTKFQIWIE
jgi:hypothetical protein